MMEDTLAIRKENYEKTFGEKSKEARREDIFRAIAQRGG
jgi:hypothetical protein